MSFSVSEAHELEPDRCQAVVRHGDQLLTVILRCGCAEAAGLPPEFTAEIDYTSVVRFETDPAPDDSLSGVFATDDPAVILAEGRVHNHVVIGPDHVLIDVCVRTGPEFFYRGFRGDWRNGSRHWVRNQGLAAWLYRLPRPVIRRRVSSTFIDCLPA